MPEGVPIFAYGSHTIRNPIYIERMNTHGTTSSYVGGCRCPECKTAMSDYQTGVNNTLRYKPMLKSQYQVTPERWEELMVAQDYSCGLCHEAFNFEARLMNIGVDHDHSCCPGMKSCGSCVRGILCKRCNSGLGYFNDDPDALRRAAEWVSRTPSLRF